MLDNHTVGMVAIQVIQDIQVSSALAGTNVAVMLVEEAATAHTVLVLMVTQDSKLAMLTEAMAEVMVTVMFLTESTTQVPK